VVWALLDHGADPLILYVASTDPVVMSRQPLSEFAVYKGYPPGKEGMFAWLMGDQNENTVELEKLSEGDTEYLKRLYVGEWPGAETAPQQGKEDRL